MGAGKGKPGLILGEGFILLVFGHLDVGGRRLDCRPTRQAHDGKYQLGQNAPTDILPPCQEMVPRLFDQGIEAVRPQGLIGQ